MLLEKVSQSKEINDNMVEKVLHAVDDSEYDWAKFCLFPDMVKPARMPSLFPVPTHMLKRRIVTTCQVGPSRKNAFLWMPEAFHGVSGIVGAASGGTDNSVNTASGNIVSDFGDNAAREAVVAGAISDTIAAGGIRLVGAYLKIEYLGKIDDISGLVEVAMHMNSHTATYDEDDAFWKDIHLSTESEIQQQHYYQSHRLSENVKVLWFPIDDSRFTLQPCHRFDATNEDVAFDNGEIRPSGVGTTDVSLYSFPQPSGSWARPSIIGSAAFNSRYPNGIWAYVLRYTNILDQVVIEVTLVTGSGGTSPFQLWTSLPADVRQAANTWPSSISITRTVGSLSLSYFAEVGFVHFGVLSVVDADFTNISVALDDETFRSIADI